MAAPKLNAEPQPGDPKERVWEIVAHSPLDSLWRLHGTPPREIARRAGRAVMADHVFGHAAELGFYFLFSLFPTLFCAGSILGMMARSAHSFYFQLLSYLSLVIPTAAMGTVLTTVTQTTAAATSNKITFSFIGAIWSASIGISAIQDTLNEVYKIRDTRSYFVARLYAIGLTVLITVITIVALASMFGGDFVAAWAEHYMRNHAEVAIVAFGGRVVGWAVATALLILIFAALYYWAPDWRKRRWRWLTPGGAVGVFGWLVVSLGLRVYLHFFNNYSVTYGSLGAVIILLTWFYITGLMLLVGAEINCEIEAAAVQKRLAASGQNDADAPHRPAA